MSRGRAVRRLVHADAALRAGAWTPVEDRGRLHQEAAPTARTGEAKCEYADDADREKAEHGHAKIVIEPGSGSPTPGEDSDDDQAQAQKAEPPTKRFSDRHRVTLPRLPCLAVQEIGCKNIRPHATNAMTTPSAPLKMMGVVSRYFTCTPMNTRLSTARITAARIVRCGCQ